MKVKVAITNSGFARYIALGAKKTQSRRNDVILD